MLIHTEKLLEEWRDIPDWKGRYQVSNHGRVRSLRNKEGMLPEPRILRQSLDGSGYCKVGFAVRHATVKTYKVHSLVLLAFVGPRPEKMEARHKDGNRTNAHLSNLVWGTKAENEADRKAHGRTCHGENHPHAKLTIESATWVKAWRQSGYSIRAIAAAFDLAHATIFAVISGQTWRAA